MGLQLGDFNRGADAIKAAAKGGGKAGGFAPQVKWEVGEEKFVQFLLPIELSPTVLVHEWIDCGTKKIGDKTVPDYGFFLSRKDSVIGEETDPLEEKGSVPRKRVMSVAVELEPEMAPTGKGNRVRPKGFSVITSTYDRKTDDGTEEVTQPAVGYVSQASSNFFKTLVSYDESGEYEGTVFKIKRTDDKTYVFTPYFDQEVDYTNLIENIDGLSYISRDEETWDELEPKLEAAEDDFDKAFLVAVALLERRLNELADFDEYQAKTAHIEKVESKYDNSGSGNKKSERPARPSQRRGATAEKSDNGGSEGGEKTAKSKQRFGEILAMANQGKK